MKDFINRENIIYLESEKPKACFVFAHGAGADMSHSFMENISKLLVSKHISVLRFNFPYMEKRKEDGKRRPPDRMPKLLECYRETIFNLDLRVPIFIGGKSMGSRVAATIANEFVDKVSGVVCLGYPFHPQKKPENLRLEPLQETNARILIIQGERDALGNKEEIQSYELSSMCEIKYLPDGDHDFKPRVKSGITHQINIEKAAELVYEFIEERINEQ